MDDSKHSDGPPAQNTGRTLRLRFAYDKSNVQLVSRQTIDKTPPPPAPKALYEGQTGFWYELRDREEHVLYQRAIQNPIRFDEEIFTNEEKQSITRRPVDDPHGIFTLLVPNLPDGYAVVLFSSPLNPEAAAQPAKELVRFALSQETRQ